MSDCEDCEDCGATDCECVLPAGMRVPFVQTGMIVHFDDCSNCERGGHPSLCTWIVASLYDAGEHMEARLALKSGESVLVTCRDLRQSWRLARDFDQRRTHTGAWVPGRALAAAVCEGA